ncbi:phosphorylated adapter RNA export protein [Galendromus occidentalis]|uniref:Phosphorylated adapter RNA export protein n=1 Tax=Galendromus occidentalis TaxID=34638 RepID=A0AAJ6VVT1_9ACAR|nr:phosphorylated adapter RNA export protein [Galendromus occidentalis]
MYRLRDSDSSDCDSSDGETSWKRAPRDTIDRQTTAGDPPVASPKHSSGARRKNRIWGDVVQEEALTMNMTAGFGVQVVHKDLREDRGVESYDFTKARFDPRPALEPVPTEIPEKLKELRAERAKELRSRLGVPEAIDKLGRDPTTDKVVQEICRRLKEPKSDLIGRAVSEIGTDLATDLLYAAETIEANGGLMINNGSRRRTPGGVFLHLLRNDKRVDKETVDRVFEAETQARKVEAKKRKRSAVERKAARAIRALEAKMFGDNNSRSQSSNDDEDEGMDRAPPKKVAPAERARSGTSDLEDGEIDD